MTSDLSNASLSTEPSGGHKIHCHRCDEPITDWMEVRRYGFWDVDEQWYESHGGIQQHYCRSCWNDQEGRTNGAHFFPESAQHLYDVLDAADGALAATLSWWTGRPSVRVVDGEPEAAVTKPHDGGTKSDGTPILRFEPKRIEFGMEEFEEDGAADPPEERGLVLLKDPERTSFGGLDDAE